MTTNSEINAVVGATVRRLRNEKRMTREELSEQLDVSSRFLASVEGGTAGVSLTTLKKLCVVFGVSADVFLGLTDGITDHSEIISRIEQLDPKYNDDILAIITAFCKAVKK